MSEEWKVIDNFPEYSVSDQGNIRSDKSDRILALNLTQYGLYQVGLMRNRVQYHRSVPLLVSKAFLAPVSEAFDTPINKDGDRTNNRVENLLWRPRWFAIRYNQQFRYENGRHISSPVVDLKTGVVSDNSLTASKTYGLLEEDLVLSIMNRTYVWPTYQEFSVVGD